MKDLINRLALLSETDGSKEEQGRMAAKGYVYMVWLAGERLRPFYAKTMRMAERMMADFHPKEKSWKVVRIEA